MGGNWSQLPEKTELKSVDCSTQEEGHSLHFEVLSLGRSHLLETSLQPYLPSKADVETESGQHKDLQWGFPDVGPEER